MFPLFVLLGTFLTCVLSFKISSGRTQFHFSAQIAMAVMLFFTAIGHFLFTKGMTMMIPEAVPCKTEIVYLTGIFEIVLGIGLLIPVTRILAARTLIVFFILVLPSNIKTSEEHINYSQGNFDGPGPSYLWFRVPLQILFIAWIYYSSLKRRSNQKQIA